MFKGEIQIVLRDAATGDIDYEKVFPNIVTDALYNRIQTFNSLAGLVIAINGKSMAPSRWNARFPGGFSGNLAAVADGQVPSIGASPQYFPAAGNVPAFLQYSGRFNPPSVSRTLKTVALINGVNNATMSNPASADQAVTYAYAPLANPCTQTSSQVLDVYYRVFFPLPTDGSVPQHLAAELFQRYLTDPNMFLDYSTNTYQFYYYHTLYPTPISPVKSGDENLTPVSQAPHQFGRHIAWAYGYTGADSFSGTFESAYYTRRMSRNEDFGDYVGRIIAADVVGGSTNYGGVTVNDTPNSNGEAMAAAWRNFKGVPKIQNLIGHGTAVKPLTTSPWLDVDNLATGTGRVVLGGDWNNRATPSAPGLYYRASLPQWNTVQIVTSGQVGDGSAAYVYRTQPFFGLVTTSFNSNPYCYTFMPLANMCGTTPAYGGPNGGSFRKQTWDAGKTLVEDVSRDTGAGTLFDVRQISAACRYDDTSFIFVKKNMLILYGIGAGDYWKFKGGFTNVTQVAVAAGKIYVGCRNTGLYVIDPKTSLAVTRLNAPGSGADLSRCFGVATGANDTLFAVGVNGILRINANGSTALYNEASTPAFSIVGVSDSNYDSVAYLKVDDTSPDFQMMLVRQYTALVNVASFGVWWSLATPAADAFVDDRTKQKGRPRVHSGHFGGRDGLWAMANGSHYVMPFGGTPIAVPGAIPNDKFGDLYADIMIVRNAAGQPRLMLLCQSTGMGGSYGGVEPRAVLTRLVDITGTVTDSVQSGLMIANNVTGLGLTNTRARGSDDDAPYAGGVNISAHSFILDTGVLVSLFVGTEDGPGYYGVSSYYDNLMIGVSNYALDFGLSGGPLAYLAQRVYGWTGSAWSTATATPKPVHATAQPLLEGVTVRFEEGGAGTSMAVPNYYKFGLCEGILKDNATRYNLASTLYFHRLFKDSTLLTAAAVPAVTALPTGVVALSADPGKYTPGTVYAAYVPPTTDPFAADTAFFLNSTGPDGSTGFSDDSANDLVVNVLGSTVIQRNAVALTGAAGQGLRVDPVPATAFGTHTMTVEGYVKTNSQNGGPIIMDQRSATNPNGLVIFFNGSRLCAYTGDAGSNGSYGDKGVTTATNEIPNGVRIYFSITVTPTALILDYHTGSPKQAPGYSTTVSRSGADLGNSAIFIGCNYVGGAVFDGDIDHLRITYAQRGPDDLLDSGFTDGLPHITFPTEAGLQYAVGDKQVSGDFDIEYSTADFKGPKTTHSAAFGVGKPGISGLPQFGFVFSAGNLYAWDSVSATSVNATGMTSMHLRRVAGVLQLVINNNVVFTGDPARTRIRAGDLRLNTMFSLWQHTDPSYMLPNCRMPVTTVVTNGSDNAVFVGDNTVGVASPRFLAVDADSVGLNTVSLDGVPAVVKADGTAPAVGEVAIDGYMGALYFNPADAGKALAAKITFQQSE